MDYRGLILCGAMFGVHGVDMGSGARASPATTADRLAVDVCEARIRTFAMPDCGFRDCNGGNTGRSLP